MPLRWTRRLIADERYEAADVFDVNGDGVLDIVSGAFWYEGPGFDRAHRIGEVAAVGEYFDSFAAIPMDVDGDGRPDIVDGSWWGPLRWRRNPGPGGDEWPERVIAECGNIEAILTCDIDGDGTPEIVPNTPGGPLVAYRLERDSAGRAADCFSAHTLHPRPQGHGLGCGDIAGAGRVDFVLPGGWLEAPADPLRGKWEFHPELDLGGASVPILVADVNRDGLADLIVGAAHNYGLDWWEQTRDAAGRRGWRRHPIDPYESQYHAMEWVDIDGDGEPELVTGKRYRAHCGNDPGEHDDIGLYYFKWNGESFTKLVIDHGPVREATGCGIRFAVADLRRTGRLDIVAPGKDGLYVFYNEGP